MYSFLSTLKKKPRTIDCDDQNNDSSSANSPASASTATGAFAAGVLVAGVPITGAGSVGTCVVWQSWSFHGKVPCLLRTKLYVIICESWIGSVLVERNMCGHNGLQTHLLRNIWQKRSGSSRCFYGIVVEHQIIQFVFDFIFILRMHTPFVCPHGGVWGVGRDFLLSLSSRETNKLPKHSSLH